jgi:hypothetical protein
MVKPDVDKLSTVPAAPPEAGPDRALDPPPGAGAPDDAEGGVADAEGGVAVAEGDDVQAADTPTTPINAAATIHPRFLVDSNRRPLGRRACSAMVAESGEDAGAAPAPPELAAAGGPDVALETERAGRGSWGFAGS